MAYFKILAASIMIIMGAHTTTAQSHSEKKGKKTEQGKKKESKKEKKQNKISEPFYPTDDMDADFKFMKSFYEGVEGKVKVYS